jgi:hypothetical protein
LTKARECGATEDEITETLVYTMRPAAAKVRKLGNSLISKVRVPWMCIVEIAEIAA